VPGAMRKAAEGNSAGQTGCSAGLGQDVRDLCTEVRVLEAPVNSAVVVNVVYLAPVLGFAA